MTSAFDVQQLTRRRTEEIFADLRRQLFVQTDHVFAVLMTVQWIFGVAAAYWISPLTWAGSTSQVHIHVWAAVILGGVISAVPILLAIFNAGSVTTRYVIAVGQMLTSALLIHLTGGRIETHFHVFGSLAFLAFYRDWRVLVPATIVIAADHFIRGIYFPQSVYGVLVASNWRFLEHAGWVVFEDIVLVWSCVRGTQHIWRVADRTAEFETSEERYRAVVDQTADGIVVFDAETRAILEHNPAFVALMGATPETIRRLIVDDRVMPGPDRLDDIIGRLLRDGAPVVSEREISRANGTRVEVSCSLSRTTYARSQAVCAVVRDITERKRVEEEIERARDAAVESARLKSEFLANMSHEIRTPMNGVVGMTTLLLDTELSKQQRDFAETIQTSADSLLTIINDILDFSKVEAGKLHFEVLDFDLHHTIEGAVDLLVGSAFAKNLELAALVERDVPPDLRGDPGRLRQILTNLVGNAIKFTERGEVSIGVSLVGETASDALLRFEVRDTGIGIPPSVQGRLFNAFTQADGSTTRKYGGTGLGLAISKRLVELMGGEIGYHSAPGGGSTFWFTARFERQTPVRLAPAIVRTLAGRRVLIVDDSELARDVLRAQLTAWGVDARQVSGGFEALAVLREAAASGSPFELAVLDRDMPGMDGLMLARAIKRDAAIAGVPLVMITTLADIGHDAQIVEAGALASITKPVKHAQLREALVRALGHRGESRSSPPQPVTPPAALPSARARVLIAEDNIVNQKVALAQLRSLGYSADAVANGAEAVEALSRIPYDVVLMDCHMPIVDGFEATRLIRRMAGEMRHVPIIAVTANAMDGDREECLAVGMDDYVSKPIAPTELEIVLSRNLRRRRAPMQTPVQEGHAG